MRDDDLDEISRRIREDRGPRFVVGQKVRCVNNIRPYKHGVIMPVKGKVYTVRGYPETGSIFPSIAIWLREIKNKRWRDLDGRMGDGGRYEPTFWQGHFEPVAEVEAVTEQRQLEPA